MAASEFKYFKHTVELHLKFLKCLFSKFWISVKFSLYVRVYIKTISWKFCILNPKRSRVIYLWNLVFLKKVGYFLTNLLFLYVCKHSGISGANNSKSKCFYNVKPSAYCFHVKTNISVDFQIYISVPLRNSEHLTTPRSCLWFASNWELCLF